MKKSKNTTRQLACTVLLSLSTYVAADDKVLLDKKLMQTQALPSALPAQAVSTTPVAPANPVTKTLEIPKSTVIAPNNGNTGIIDGKSVYKPQGAMPIGINNSCLGDCSFTINGTNYPTYKAGDNLTVNHTKLASAGVRAQVTLYLPLDNIRRTLNVQSQNDGSLTTHVPDDLYALKQKVTLELTIGNEKFTNDKGSFIPVIVDVDDSIIQREIIVECVRDCLPSGGSNNVPGVKKILKEINSMSHKLEMSALIDGTSSKVGEYWGQANRSMIWELRSNKRLKPQFELTAESVMRGSAASLCASGTKAGTHWSINVYSGNNAVYQPVSIATDGSISGYVSPDVAYCWFEDGGITKTRYLNSLYSTGHVDVYVRGPKGVNPWR